MVSVDAECISRRRHLRIFWLNLPRCDQAKVFPLARNYVPRDMDQLAISRASQSTYEGCTSCLLFQFYPFGPFLELTEGKNWTGWIELEQKI